MANKSTCTVQLEIDHESEKCPVGLCLSWKAFDSLKKDRDKMLHPKEASYADALKYSKRQHSFLLGRHCAKKAVSLLSGKSAEEILVENGVFGQPVLKLKNTCVSISHSGELGGAIAFQDIFPMALDLECMVYQCRAKHFLDRQ